MLAGVLFAAACGGGGNGSDDSASPPRGLSYATPQTLTLGSAITPLAPTVVGPVTSYSVSPPLPTGLTLDGATGAIAGTPGVTSPAAIYRVTATNGAGASSFDLTIAVNYPLPFWIEPTGSTVIGVDQVISVAPAFKTNAGDPHPIYLDPAEVAWSSSHPACASVAGDGTVRGMSACSTVITATHNGHTSQLAVQVSGMWVNRSVTVAGQGSRGYSVYLPDFGSDANPHPAILSLHGGGGSALLQASTSQLVNLAHQQKIYLAFLEGSGAIKTWNAGACCGYAKNNGIDDVAYVEAVLADLEATDDVDTARIYATGMSNGGMMTHRLACAIPDRIAGVAAVAGAAAEFDLNLTQYYVCNPSRPIPVLHIHAANDRNYPYAGGAGDGLSDTDYYPVESAIADWRARNNVNTEAITERVTATTTCYRYATPADIHRPSAPVTLCKSDPVDVYDPTTEIVFGGGHSWPGGVRSPSSKSDTPLMEFDANRYLWRYFTP